MSNEKAILAVLAGVATGAAFGVLFAPDKGSGTRKKISRKGRDLVDALNNKVEQKFNELLSSITGKEKESFSQNDSLQNKKEMAD